MKKRGMELVISTLVVIILALLMLVMGTILVKKTYCAAMMGVTSMEELSEQEIMRLFSEQNSRVAVKELQNEISKGVYYGVGFVVENEEASSTGFSYSVEVLDLQDCQISESEAIDYIVSTKSATFNVAPGDTYSRSVEFNIPRDAPVCSLSYEINVEKDEKLYGSATFQVIIKETGWVTSSLC